MQKEIRTLRNELTRMFPERAHVIDGALAAVLAREHILLLGPPGCLASDTIINVNRGGNGFKIVIADLVARLAGKVPEGGQRPWDLSIPTMCARAENGTIRLAKIKAAWESGVKTTYELVTESGRSIRATDEHPFMGADGTFKPLGQLKVGDSVQVNIGMQAPGKKPKVRYRSRYTKFHPYQRAAKDGFRHVEHRLVAEAKINGVSFDEYLVALRTDEKRSKKFVFLPSDIHVHHIDHDPNNNHPDNLSVMTKIAHHKEHGDDSTNAVLAKTGVEKIVSIEKYGEEMTYDIEVEDDPHNFIANGFVVHNTAKSALVRAISQALGGSYFERLMTKFSTPEELFGPISLKALENDQFKRNTKSTLVDAEFAFVDEIFKSNSAILNALLAVMNERVFHNDGPVQVPLVSMFGASNELPEGKELEALFDRFMLRFEVDYVLRPSSFRTILAGGNLDVKTRLSMEQLRQAHVDVSKVKVSDATVDALLAIRDALKLDGFVVSDRRWKKSLKLAQAGAYINGETETSPEDLTFLADSLWRDPKDRSKIAKVVGRLADPVTAQVVEILDAAKEIEQKVANVKADRKQYITQAATALELFQQQIDKLNKLAKGASKRGASAVQDASNEIALVHDEMARNMSAGLGLARR